MLLSDSSNDDRYESRFGETRFRLPLHLLRCTICSFGPAHDKKVVRAPEGTPWKLVVVRLLPPAG